ncbi:MAG: ATP-dependent helicase HrpB, partial [Clostridia bacterium]
LALLDEPWLDKQRIVMLEPRKLAARSAARFMAASLGEQVGKTVGYRVRNDTKVGPDTRIEVITEGVLTRMLQADPSLDGIGLVIFDEFHERSLHADLGLALCLQSRDILREDLRILVMSATLEAEPVAALLGDAPVISSEGRVFPIETHYRERRIDGRIEPHVVRSIVQALKEEEGDLLVFLPGAGEIRKVEALLAEEKLDTSVRIAPLYGTLPQEAQDRAILPGRNGERKVVLATSIAETSLTVEGVRVVIDSGLMRVPRFSPRTGMTRLVTIQVSRASADQRRGRAGRLGPGVCYRLWTEQEDRHLQPRSTPEIKETDLASLALELAIWGVADPSELEWIDPPPAAAYSQALGLLKQLGAIADGLTITEHGRKMAALGLQPRLAHMILSAIPLGYGEMACELAALLGERDILRSKDADLRERLEVLRSVGAGGRAESAYQHEGVDLSACKRIWKEAGQWKRELNLADEKAGGVQACGLLLAFAYPDRIGQGKGNGRFLLSNGRGALLDGPPQPLSNATYLVAAELDDQGADSRIFLAAAVERSELEQFCQEQIVEEMRIVWDSHAKAVQARKQTRLGALVLKDQPLADADPDQVLAALLEGIAQEGHAILPWTKSARHLQERLCFMHRQHGANWPDRSDEALLATLADWLGGHLYGMKSSNDLKQLNLTAILEATLSWDERRELDESAPTHIVVPSGSRIPVDYSDSDAPVLSVRLQEMFGLQDTPRIARGTVPLTLHLLSPAHRPVQVTRDLASFWRGAYFEVKKDLKGRYPKHYWPDDPNEAVPTNRVKPRG